MYIVYSVSLPLLCYIFGGVRRPDLWESRTIYICCCMFITVHIYDVVGYVLFGDEDGVAYTDTYMYILEDGIGRESALAYLYVHDVCFILRRLVPIFGLGGLLSIKQMDPVSFSAEIVNLFWIKT